MSFDVKINFSGLLHFVENKSRNSGSFKLAIVCPELDDHHGRITIGNENFSIDNERVFFKFDRAPEVKREFSFRKGALEGEIKGAVPLDLIAGSTSLSQSIVSTDTPEGVRAQIFLEEGVFAVNEGTAITWALPPDLTGTPRQIQVDPNFFATVRNIEGGVVVMEPLNGGPSRIIALNGADGDTRRVNVSYRCQKSEEEEKKFIQELIASNRFFEDIDFGAHYEMLDAATRAKIALKLPRGNRRPVPTRTLSEQELVDLKAAPHGGDDAGGEGVGAAGCNCLCTGGGTLAFNADAAFASARNRSTVPEAGLAATPEPGRRIPTLVSSRPPQKPQGPTQEQLKAAYETALATYGQRADVTGVDIGIRYKDNLPLKDEIAIRVHVREKLEESVLEAAELLPESIEGVPIDVIQATYHAQVVAFQPVTESVDRMARAEVVQPGMSISHVSAPRSTGTLGALVYDRRTGSRCILSNWHVLAGAASSMPGDHIVQPGRMDGGRAPRDTVAHLERMILDQDGDAAIAVLNAARDAQPEQLETDVVVQQVREVKIGEIVKKSGRTTELTRGRVDGVGQYKLSYSVGEVRIDGFKVVTEVEGNPNDVEISGPGDSGSLWYGADDHQGVGLHFGGEQSANPLEEHAVACHLDRVMDRLNISLIPVTRPQAAAAASIAPQASSLEPTSEIRLLVEATARLARMLEQQGLGKRD
jgi:hypothetical protein